MEIERQTFKPKYENKIDQEIPEKSQVYEFNVDAEDFFNSPNLKSKFEDFSAMNSKFNLLSNNFEAVNNKKNQNNIRYDNSFTAAMEQNYNSNPKSIDADFELNADELFSQRFFGSNDPYNKEFDFDDADISLPYNKNKITDNSGSQETYQMKSKHLIKDNLVTQKKANERTVSEIIYTNK